MPKTRTLVRASDIGRWAYCGRAWWLAVVREAPHQRPEQLAYGNRVHRAHGKTVAGAARLVRWGWILLALGLGGLIISALIWFLF
ncbi:MAG: hypothetical protein WDZ49_00995 [Litorilinea sp.]